jgi:succinate dehydrogenase / fumarate reductase iron-sulfur subunit
MPDIKFRLKRQDPHSKDSTEARWEEYTVTYEGENLTVLEGLFHIQEKFDGSLAFRFCCRASICGSCAMYINGAYRLACQTNVKHLDTDLITVEPMPHLPLVKDMVVNMDAFFQKYEYIMPWLIRNSPDPEKEINQSPEDRKLIDMPIDCILCGCCYSSCPSAWGEENYMGPAALLKAHRFEVDSRDEAGKERMKRWNSERGIYRCHTIMNCAEACPKELNPTEGIQSLKKTAVRRILFKKAK